MDRRQKKTRAAIYAAFEELMSREHYSSVTVAQIIEKADIGRSTFYAHFETKDDLLAAMCQEMFDHIFEGVNEQCASHPNLVTESLEGKLAHLLYHLRDSHSGICGKLILEGESHFTNYFRRQLRTLFERDAKVKRGAAPVDFVYNVYISAFISCANWWFQNSCKQKPEQIANWFLTTVL